jgi:acyl dehydratase
MTQDSAITPQMREAIGVESEPAEHDVEKGAIVKFARAIGDPNPAFNDDDEAHGGMVAPPTFLRSMPSGPPRVQVSSPYGANLDGGSEWEYFEPVRAGDRITAVAQLADIVERTGRLGVMIIMTIVATYRNQLDQVAATQTSTLIRY